MYRWLAVSDDGLRSPSTTVPSRSTTTIDGRGQVLVAHAGWLDGDQARLRIARADIAAGPHHQPVAGQLGMEPDELLAERREPHAGTPSTDRAVVAAVTRRSRKWLHHVVAASAEVVVQPDVLAVTARRRSRDGAWRSGGRPHRAGGPSRAAAASIVVVPAGRRRRPRPPRTSPSRAPASGPMR